MIKYTVPYADTDQMGVVYYANYLTYFERARNGLLTAAGFSYGSLERSGIQLPVIEASVRYYKPAKFEDELILKAQVAWVKRVKIKFICSVYRQKILLSEGYTVHGAVSGITGRIKPFPEEFLKTINLFPEVQE